MCTQQPKGGGWGGVEYSGLAGEEASDLGSGTKAEAAVQKVVGGLNGGSSIALFIVWLVNFG